MSRRLHFLLLMKRLSVKRCLLTVNVFLLRLAKMLGREYIFLNMCVMLLESHLWIREAWDWWARNYLKWLDKYFKFTVTLVILKLLEMYVESPILWLCKGKKKCIGRNNGNRRQFIYGVDKNAEDKGETRIYDIYCLLHFSNTSEVPVLESSLSWGAPII